MALRHAAVAGTWYPGTAAALADEVDDYLLRVPDVAPGRLLGLVAPHAGLRYSGPVAAHAYRLLEAEPPGLVVIIGPSHHVAFTGVAIWPSGGFLTPFGAMGIAEDVASALMAATPLVRRLDVAHQREHSLEMQLPFIQRLAPRARIVPLVMGDQRPATSRALAAALTDALGGRTDVLLVASSDLSHFHDAATAQQMDQVVVDCVNRFDPDALQLALDLEPDHACGGGPIITVMRVTRALGATSARVLVRADSSDVSGDPSSVVGYLSAAFFAQAPA